MVLSTSTKNGFSYEHKAEEASGNKFIVKFRQNSYDISKFISKHPGGVNTLNGLNNSDITARFMKAPPHSDAAMYLLKEYKIKNNRHKSQDIVTHEAREPLENGIELIEENINSNLLDDSMEHLVDWNKAMIPQIGKITQYYDEWVHKPVDRSLRLFNQSYLEVCTRTSWWMIPLFWLPVIFIATSSEIFKSWHEKNIPKLIILFVCFVIGILFWTLLEYSLHRWVFHMKTNGKRNAWLCTLHFLIHGLHHKVPFDSKRLVFPPIAGIIIATTLYVPLSFVVPYPRVVLSGTVFGYLCYDLMHYYLHYGSPTLKHIYHMKRYHYQHHFAHQDKGFGISSPLWDFVFNTRIKLRKLRFQLRWH